MIGDRQPVTEQKGCVLLGGQEVLHETTHHDKKESRRSLRSRWRGEEIGEESRASHTQGHHHTMRLPITTRHTHHSGRGVLQVVSGRARDRHHKRREGQGPRGSQILWLPMPCWGRKARGDSSCVGDLRPADRHVIRPHGFPQGSGARARMSGVAQVLAEAWVPGGGPPVRW